MALQNDLPAIDLAAGLHCGEVMRRELAKQHRKQRVKHRADWLRSQGRQD
jgi:hypothetical protein